MYMCGRKELDDENKGPDLLLTWRNEVAASQSGWSGLFSNS